MGAKARVVGWAATGAVAAMLGACDKTSDRQAIRSPPSFDLRYCYDGLAPAPIHLSVDSCMLSSNRAYVMRMTESGALEVDPITAGARLGAPIWTSGSHAKPRTAFGTFQEDGNLVIYGPDGAIWNSASFGSQARLSLSDDGALQITTAQDGVTLWESKDRPKPCRLHWPAGVSFQAGGCVISPKGSFALTMTPSGSLDLAPIGADGVAGAPVWTTASHSAAPKSAFAVMQGDGNLVIYDQNKAIWNSVTYGAVEDYQLDVTDQGEAIIRAPGDHKIWSSKSGKVKS